MKPFDANQPNRTTTDKDKAGSLKQPAGGQGKDINKGKTTGTTGGTKY